MNVGDTINLRQSGKVKGGLYTVLGFTTHDGVDVVGLKSQRDGRDHTLRVEDVQAGRLPLKPVKTAEAP